jgi:hypothetical protein
MLWFNEAKGSGMVVTDGDEKLVVYRGDFAAGTAPEGRCGGRPVTFDRIEGSETAQAVNVEFAPVTDPRRARLRHRR